MKHTPLFLLLALLVASLGLTGCETSGGLNPDIDALPEVPAEVQEGVVITDLVQSPSGQFLNQPVPLPHRPAIKIVQGAQVSSDAEISGHLRFPPGGAILEDAALQGAQKLIDELERSEIATAVLVGFASSPGSPGHARVLSEHRALVVREALVAVGIHPARLHTVGLGSDIPPPTGKPDQVWWTVIK